MAQVYIVPLCIGIGILIYKTVLFKQHFRRRSFVHWFYFGHSAKVISTDRRRIRQKEFQNLLTLLIGISLLLSFVLYFLYTEK